MGDDHGELHHQKLPDKNSENQALPFTQLTSRAQGLNSSWPDVALIDPDELFEFIEDSLWNDLNGWRSQGPENAGHFGIIVDVG